MLVGPALILRRKAWFALLIIADSPPVSAVDVDLLECGLEIKRGIRVFIRERYLQAREPLPERARVQLVTVPRWPSAYTAQGIERLERLYPPLGETKDMAAVAEQVDFNQMTLARECLRMLRLVRHAAGTSRIFGRTDDLD